MQAVSLGTVGWSLSTDVACKQERLFWTRMMGVKVVVGLMVAGLQSESEPGACFGSWGWGVTGTRCSILQPP